MGPGDRYAFTIAEHGPLERRHLPPQLFEVRSSATGIAQTYRSRDEKEKEVLINALKQTSGNQTQAARLLNINRVTVWNRMRKYGIDLHKQLKL